MPRKALVTGADGFIGSHLTEELVRAGYDVTAFVYYNSFGSWGWLDQSSDDIRKSIKVVPGDIRDGERVREATRGADIVFHLAALIAIPYSYHAPESYIATNVLGTLNVLQAARAYDVTRVIQTSTSEVYGTAQYVPIDEKHPLQAQSPYAASKIAADQLALSFNRSFGLPVSVLRPFNTYGPRQSARAVIPTIATQLLSGQRVLRLGNLTPTRDFTFVKDTAVGFRQFAECDPDLAVGQVVNIGSNFEISIADLVEALSDVIGAKAEILADESRVRPPDSEVDRLLADVTQSRSMFGWQPRYAGLEGFKQGLQETVSWLARKENSGYFRPDQYAI